jgi:hypothetical protein
MRNFSGSNAHFKKDGAPRGAHAAHTPRKRVRCASDTIILGILAHFSHFRHF